jgi:menaquinone-9 beta-reductase
LRNADVLIVGGGPAGLAVAIHAARQGLDTVVLERAKGPVDKACGEGLMPAGVEALVALGARSRLRPEDCAPLEGIRYIQEDGSGVQGRLRAPGLGIRRLALVTALTEQARAAGVEVREGCGLREHHRGPAGVRVETDEGALRGRLLVAADGLASGLRKAAGLEVQVSARGRRFGLRQHFARVPWTTYVEVHLSSGVEAYVTPSGSRRVGVAFLWEDGRVPGPINIQTLLQRFPLLQERLGSSLADSSPRGAGPLLQRVRARASDRLVLMGDAAGYVDAITGEGLSLTFEAASVLGSLLPEVMRQECARHAFEPYEQAYARLFRRYAWNARAVLLLARRPWLRRRVLHLLGRRPALFESLLTLAVGGPVRSLPSVIDAAPDTTSG